VANYKIELSESVQKSLKRIPKKDVSKIIEKIQIIGINPFPEGCRKLKDLHDVYRVRQGKYRIIYEVYENKLIVIVLKIGHRKDIYKK